MFKSLSFLFKKSPPKVIPVTPDLLHKRQIVCQNLEKIYKTQISLLSHALPQETVNRIPLIQHYTGLLQQYYDQLDQLEDKNIENTEFTEEKFLEILNKQLDSKVSELELINLLIKPNDLKSLNENYSPEIDSFFYNYHTNRISASYALKEYLYPKPLLQIHNANSILKQAIKTTSQMLSLNDYPIPKFDISKSESGSDINVYCISPHLVHIIFELFKNATIPSLTHGKPIKLSIYPEKDNENNIIFEVKDNGGGMPNESLNKIWQFHYTTTKDKDRDPIHGFGMGLPLCKVFTEFNDGSLELVNKEGDGVTIYIKIPRAVEQKS
jgi:signal transduction histidine kinase